MKKNCPCCGGELQSGFIQSGQRICWKQEQADGVHLPDKENGEFYLRGSGMWKGSACPGFYCPDCQLILLPQKEENHL